MAWFANRRFKRPRVNGCAVAGRQPCRRCAKPNHGSSPGCRACLFVPAWRLSWSRWHADRVRADELNALKPPRRDRPCDDERQHDKGVDRQEDGAEAATSALSASVRRSGDRLISAAGPCSSRSPNTATLPGSCAVNTASISAPTSAVKDAPMARELHRSGSRAEHLKPAAVLHRHPKNDAHDRPREQRHDPDDRRQPEWQRDAFVEQADKKQRDRDGNERDDGRSPCVRCG